MKKIAVLSVVLSLILCSTTAFAGKKFVGQTVYVPAAQNDFCMYDESENLVLEQYLLTRLIIRNIDPIKSITLTSVKFFDPDGVCVMEYLPDVIVLSPLASVTYVASPSVNKAPYYDKSGGRLSFIVQWEADENVNPPIIESARAFVTIGPEGERIVKALDVTPGTVIK